MRITINLATRPYVELRPVFKQLRIAMIVLAVVAVGLFAWGIALGKKAKAQQAKLDTVHAQTAVLVQERTRNEARMRQPENAAELMRAQFLNALFARKAFSWTAVLMDLEQVLPTGVQVMSIEPQASPNGDVVIRMRVAGDRERTVDLVRNLEKSKRFLAPRLVGEAAQQQQQGLNGRGAVPMPVIPGGVEFEIASGYNPLQARAEKEAKADAKAEAKAEVRVEVSDKKAAKTRTTKPVKGKVKP